MTGALSTAERSCPTSKVRDRSWEDPHAQRATAKRSCPTSEVRGSGRECQDVVAQERLRGRPGVAAKRSYPASEAGAVAVQTQEGLEELFHVQGQDRWL